MTSHVYRARVSLTMLRHSGSNSQPDPVVHKFTFKILMTPAVGLIIQDQESFRFKNNNPQVHLLSSVSILTRQAYQEFQKCIFASGNTSSAVHYR